MTVAYCHDYTRGMMVRPSQAGEQEKRQLVEDLRKPLQPHEGYATMYERLARAFACLIEETL